MLALHAHWIADSRMQPTLQVGDLVLGERVTYRVRAPYRGEIICYREGDRHVMGRVLAIGGDRVTSLADGIEINGARVEESYVVPPPYWLELNVVQGCVLGALREARNQPDAHVWLGTGRLETTLVASDRLLVLPDMRWGTQPSPTLIDARAVSTRGLYLVYPPERRTWLF